MTSSYTTNYNWQMPNDGDKAWGPGVRKFIFDADGFFKEIFDTQEANWIEFQAAIQNAAQTAAALDGEIVSYWQDEPPTGASVGDFWFDTNNNNKIYAWTGTQWVASTSKIAQALLAVHTAQGVADGKAKIYYQSSEPTEVTLYNQGDLWVDTATGHGSPVYVYTGTGWVLAQDSYTALVQANKALNQLTDIVSDGKLTNNEKTVIKPWWNTAKLEYTPCAVASSNSS